MKTQTSRNSFRAYKRYSGVYQQMGRMFTDADWNELSDLTKHRLADTLTDAIGSGTPRDRGLVEVTDNGDGTYSHALRWGYAYVDGIVAQVRPDPHATLSDPSELAFEYDHQADFPSAPPAEGDHILYLDVWERTVVTLEDDDLRDPGLHGADTCTRTQTMAQVKWCESTVDPEDPLQNPPIGVASLSLEIREASEEGDSCDPCADVIDIQGKVGNYLFRVEVHDVEYDGISGLPQRVSLKWSSENGAEHAVIDQEPAGFVDDDWAYEFYDGHVDEEAASLETLDSEKHLGKHLAPGFSPTRGDLYAGYPDTLPSGYTAVRRWDGYCELQKTGTGWTLVTGFDSGVPLSTTADENDHGRVVEGATLTINLEAITLRIDLSDHQLLAGDYWYAVVREALHGQGSELLTDGEPVGIRHHYMTLGSVTGGLFTAYESGQCRRFEFPPLTDIRALDVCFDKKADCEMPDVNTVQEAIDFLCRERDLRWHNQHLHGWGIVCGLIAQCIPLEAPGEGDDDGNGNGNGEQEEPDRDREVRITEGYALTCEGEDLVLNDFEDIDVIERIEQMQEAGIEVLDEAGNGTVCLRLDPADDGKPEFSIEAYDPEAHGDESLLDGTLLMDFYEKCIVRLIDALKKEFETLDPGELDEVEGGSTGLVSTRRRKITSVLNLFIQLFSPENGGYVYISEKEHLILRDFYLTLQALLQSNAYCGMYQGDEYPEYPFTDADMSTYFGKNLHTRVKVHPSSEFIYTYGGSGNDTGNTINVYDAATEELIQVIEMPSAEGAEVSAITFSENGNLLYATAVVRDVDTVFATARVKDDHTWEKATILCGVRITEMELSTNDPDLIYAVGRGTGLYYLRPDLFIDQNEPQPPVVYLFNASGHMAIDHQRGLAYCTELSEGDTGEGEYDTVVVCELNIDEAADALDPNLRMRLIEPSAAALITRRGRDGLAIRLGDANGEGGRLYVVVDPADQDTDQAQAKQLWSYNHPLNAEAQPAARLDIENTQVSLDYHGQSDHLVLAMEDSYRLQLVEPDGQSSQSCRVPVQIQPVDLIVDDEKGRVYVLNYLSNTLNVIPAEEVQFSEASLNQLVDYRTQALTAFYGLAGGLFQYLKDCFCDRFLVNCPTCDNDEVLYLATINIREFAVDHVCNFNKRKYVKSFPTMGYWFSLIPIWPLLKKAMAEFCCTVLPNWFDEYRDRVVRRPDVDADFCQPVGNFFSAIATRGFIQNYERTDIKAFTRNQVKGISFAGSLAGDYTTNFLSSAKTRDGVPKQSLMNSSVNDATLELNNNNIEVAEVKEYDAKEAGKYAGSYLTTPQNITPGSKVTLYQKNGKVAFYAVEKEQPSVAVELSDSAKAEIEAYEARKASLADFSAVDAELARVETRYANVSALDEIKTELTQLQTQKNEAQEELAALRSQVDSVKTERAAEQEKLTQLEAQRVSIAASVSELNQSVLMLAEQQKEIQLEVAKSRPVRDISEVNEDVDLALRDAGIRTVEELSNADSQKLIESGAIDENTAKLIIDAAKLRLEK
jgi:hypothetical protein